MVGFAHTRKDGLVNLWHFRTRWVNWYYVYFVLMTFLKYYHLALHILYNLSSVLPSSPIKQTGSMWTLYWLFPYYRHMIRSLPTWMSSFIIIHQTAPHTSSLGCTITLNCTICHPFTNSSDLTMDCAYNEISRKTDTSCLRYWWCRCMSLISLTAVVSNIPACPSPFTLNMMSPNLDVNNQCSITPEDRLV